MPVGPSPEPTNWVALSIKQPWAALLMAGVKTIEVRTWSTKRRGLVLIHASKIPDERPEAWAFVNTPELEEAAKIQGGIIGIGELAECRTYDSQAKFDMDQRRHRNAASWFRPPRLFGLVFKNIQPVPFFGYTGQTMFFGVKGDVPRVIVQPPEKPVKPNLRSILHRLPR